MNGEAEASIDVSSLDTHEGISTAAVAMARVSLDAVVYPVLDSAPVHQRAVVWERYLSALTGGMAADVGAEVASRILDEVKLALATVQAERERKH